MKRWQIIVSLVVVISFGVLIVWNGEKALGDPRSFAAVNTSLKMADIAEHDGVLFLSYYPECNVLLRRRASSRKLSWVHVEPMVYQAIIETHVIPGKGVIQFDFLKASERYEALSVAADKK